MVEPIHDDEVDTSESVVRAVLASERPDWAELPLSFVNTSGTDNAMWRLHRATDADLAIRLPRTARAARCISRECSLLPRLADTTFADVYGLPSIVHVGSAMTAGAQPFPLPWIVTTWLDGDDAWSARDDIASARDQHQLARDLADAVYRIRSLTAMPVDARPVGQRGGPLAPLLARLDRWLDDPHWNATDLVDVDAVRRCAHECAEVVDVPVERGFVHGDLIPGNLLVNTNRLSAVIDWGGSAIADMAQDLAPAWSILDRRSRPTFRDVLAVDDETWLRGRAFELEHAVGGILYYAPRTHPLADVMTRTLDRVLHDT